MSPGIIVLPVASMSSASDATLKSFSLPIPDIFPSRIQRDVLGAGGVPLPSTSIPFVISISAGMI